MRAWLEELIQKQDAEVPTEVLGWLNRVYPSYLKGDAASVNVADLAVDKE